MRYSHQRETVLNVLKGCKDHPTAETVFLRARDTVPNISLATVYRNLRTLSDNGDVLTLETVDKKIHYDGDISDHGHFICRDCGRIIDIFSRTELPPELEELELEVDSAKTVYYGKCAGCRRLSDKKI